MVTAAMVPERLAVPAVGAMFADTGHMRWAGMDPASIIQAYQSRVQAIHIKDVFPDYLAADKASSSGYFELTGTKRVWAEPGRGIIDFEALVDAMPSNFAGDYMIEVDVPSVESRYESQKISYEWARSALSFARI